MIRRHLPSPFLAMLLWVVTLAAMPEAASAASEGEEAAAVVTRLQTGLLKLDKENSRRDNAQRYGAFAPLVDSTHDLGYMARIAMSRFWGTFSADQQRKFEAEFRRLSVMGYAARFRDTAGSSFMVDQVRVVPGGRVEVATRLMAPSEPAVSLNYVLHRSKAGWQIINILAEGVSDLALQRSQYQQVMQSQGFDGLVAHLKKKADDLETGSKEP
jgi:phospholipid transport system substrate-binding protein